MAPSDGLARLFEDNTADLREFVAVRIVRGGQGANPSTGELLEAVEATPADELLILPNNPNVILAARQVAGMTERPVHVVPTRNCAEGFASLIALDASDSAAENVDGMTEASRDVQTLQVTAAVRDATVSGRKVKKGQTIVLDPDDGLLAVDSDAQRGGPRRHRAARGRLQPRHDLLRRHGDARRGRDDRPQGGAGGAGSRGRPRAPRRTAALPVPDRRRVSRDEDPAG